MKLFTALKYAILLSLLICLCNCAMALHSNCLDSSILAAETYRDAGYPIRFSYGMGKKQLHIQAQAFIDGKWKWLKVDKIYTWRQDDFKATQTMTLEEVKAYWRRRNDHP